MFFFNNVFIVLSLSFLLHEKANHAHMCSLATSTEFCNNPSGVFCVIILTDRQQTNKDDNITSLAEVILCVKDA